MKSFGLELYLANNIFLSSDIESGIIIVCSKMSLLNCGHAELKGVQHFD